MSDDTTMTTEPTDTAQPAEHMIPKSRLDEVLKRAHDAEDALKKREAAEKKAADDAAAKRGEWERIAADREHTIAEREAERDAARLESQSTTERLTALEDAMRQQVAAMKKALPDDLRDLVPEGDVLSQFAWLSKATPKLTGSPSPRMTPSGPRGTGQTPRADTEFSDLVAQKRARIGGF